jgi:hypothetical protein
MEKSVWKLGSIALFGPLKQILLDLNIFFRFAHLKSLNLNPDFEFQINS